MAHQTSSTDKKGKTRADPQLLIPSSRSQSQQPASQTLRYFAATADSATPYISPYPPTTDLNTTSRGASSVEEPALPVGTSTCSSSPQASSLYSSAGSTLGIMSASSKTISVVCETSAHAFTCFFPTIILILSPMRCIFSALRSYLFPFRAVQLPSCERSLHLNFHPTYPSTKNLSLLNIAFRTRKLSWSVRSKHTRSIPSPNFGESRRSLLLPTRPIRLSPWQMLGPTTSTRTTCSASYVHWQRIILSAPSAWMQPSGR